MPSLGFSRSPRRVHSNGRWRRLPAWAGQPALEEGPHAETDERRGPREGLGGAGATGSGESPRSANLRGTVEREADRLQQEEILRLKRELENLIKRLVVLESEESILADLEGGKRTDRAVARRHRLHEGSSARGAGVPRGRCRLRGRRAVVNKAAAT